MAQRLTTYMQNVWNLLISSRSSIVLGSALGAYLIRRLIIATSKLSTTPALQPNKLTDGRFELDKVTSDTCTLPDGRKLSYAQFGQLTGRPILYLHGLPGSRIEGNSWHDYGVEQGARIIAVDRPGFGQSTPHPGRTMLDFPKDLEYLTEHLKLDTYAVIGASGGGPYALSCAAALPSSKLKCVSIICGLGPPDIGMVGAGIMHRLGFTIGWRYGPPFLLRWFLTRDPVFNTSLSDDERLRRWQDPSTLAQISHPRELDIMHDTDYLRLCIRSMTEAQAQGFKWICQDGALMCVDFGFRVEDIRKDLPMQLWYGRDDTFVPMNHGLQIARRLGDRAVLRVEDDSHGSISYRWKREVLEAVLAVM